MQVYPSMHHLWVNSYASTRDVKPLFISLKRVIAHVDQRRGRKRSWAFCPPSLPIGPSPAPLRKGRGEVGGQGGRWARSAAAGRSSVRASAAGPAIGPAMPPPGQTQLPDWDGLKLRVRTLIASHRVMIFSKSYCPYCNKVRRRRPGVASARSPPPPGPSSPARQPPERGLSEQLPSSRRPGERRAEGFSPRGGGGPGAAPVRGEGHLP